MNDGGPVASSMLRTDDVLFSIRDCFAAHVISAAWNELSFSAPPETPLDEIAKVAANMAYKLADAMLERRKS
jgi:hypothetical protein